MDGIWVLWLRARSISRIIWLVSFLAIVLGVLPGFLSFDMVPSATLFSLVTRLCVGLWERACSRGRCGACTPLSVKHE